MVGFPEEKSVLPLRADVLGRVKVQVHEHGICAVGQQELGHFHRVGGNRNVQRCVGLWPAEGVDVRPVLEEAFHHLDVALLDGGVQEGALPAVTGVDVGVGSAGKYGFQQLHIP
jgi:hypothetical protein